MSAHNDGRRMVALGLPLSRRAVSPDWSQPALATGLDGVTAPPMEISDDRLPVLFKS
jgi:hypothetical protein